MIINRGDLIIQCYLDDKFPYYVQEVALLDVGRFTTLEAAKEHKKFLESSN